MNTVQQILITESDFDVATEYQNLCDAAPQAGAVVFFVGLVRDLYEPQDSTKHDSTKHGADDKEPQKIEYLELEHYAGMTEAMCQQIIEQANQRYPFEAARVVHRVGKLYACEQIVMVAVASLHRENAFQAADYIMDYLKTRATLWKKEVGERGQNWIGMKSKDRVAVQRWVKE